MKSVYLLLIIPFFLALSCSSKKNVCCSHVHVVNKVYANDSSLIESSTTDVYFTKTEMLSIFNNDTENPLTIYDSKTGYVYTKLGNGINEFARTNYNKNVPRELIDVDSTANFADTIIGIPCTVLEVEYDDHKWTYFFNNDTLILPQDFLKKNKLFYGVYSLHTNVYPLRVRIDHKKGWTIMEVTGIDNAMRTFDIPVEFIDTEQDF